MHALALRRALEPTPAPAPPAPALPQYPPLVEARCTQPGGLFAGLTDGGWEHFMLIVRHQIDASLQSGAWKQAAAGVSAPPPASCPRF